MPNVFESFEPMSFAGVEFPWESYTIEGGIEVHQHKYPHVDGANIEKLGRKLYEVKITPVFQAGLLPERYSRLFPDNLRTLRRIFEEQTTDDLVIPDIGSIKACAIAWNHRATAINVSGVKPEFTFLEDQSGLFGETFVLFTNQLQSKLQNWTIEADRLPEDASIFDKINEVALQVLAIRDQSDLFGGLVLAKVEGLVSLIQEADSVLTSFDDPDNVGALEALHAMMAATVALGRDVASKGQGLQVYTVPLTMSIGQVSIALYGDSTRGAEVMQLNTLDNPLSIPAGTKVVYYAK